MARFRFQFGKSESLECLPGIERFDIGTADGTQNVCYAAKVATESVILPWRTYVDDYVFAVDGSNFYNTTRDSIRAEQAAGNLPAQLPNYQIEPASMFFGHILWPALMLFAAYCGLCAKGYIKVENAPKANEEPNLSNTSSTNPAQAQPKA